MTANMRYLSYVLRHKWFVLLAGLKTGAPVWRLLAHDLSKFLPAEWGAYVRKFYGAQPNLAVLFHRYGGRPNHEANVASWKAERDAAFDRAWLHHQHANPHHWQHWVLREDSGAVKLLAMPEHFIREMVADWMGAGRAITGQWEAAAWYLKNRDVIQLEEHTRIRVERLLAVHAGLKCVWGCNGGSPAYCESMGGCEAHCSRFEPKDIATINAGGHVMHGATS
jgi:hypothetical protein